MLVNFSKLDLLLFMYIVPVICGKPMPSPIMKMTFLGFVKGVAGGGGGAPAPDLAVLQDVAAINTTMDNTEMNRLTDRCKFLAWK